jgi:acyl dehydratase
MAPVRPGDVLHLEGEVESLTPSKTKPHGTVVMKWTMYNQHGQAVYTFTPMAYRSASPGHMSRC